MSRIRRFFTGRRVSRASLLLAAALTGIGLGRLGRHRLDHSAAAAAAATAATARATADPAGPSRATPEAALPGGPGHAPGLLETLSARTAAQLSRNRGADYWLYLLAATENAPPDLLARLLDSLGGEPSATTLLGRRWAQLDPAGMLAFLKSRPFSKDNRLTDSATGRQDRNLQQVLAQEWLRKDSGALFAALSRTEKPSLLKAAKLETLRLLVSTDAGRAADLMLGWGLPLDSADGPALIAWVQSHPRQAAERLLRRREFQEGGSNDSRCLLLNETVKALAATDPAGALKMEPGPRSSLFYHFSTAVLSEWSRRDPAAAAAFLSDGGLSPQRKNDLSLSLLQVWGTKDPAAALAWADDELTGPAKSRAVKTLLSSLAAVDTPQALDYLDRLPPGRARDEIFEGVVETALRKKDKTEALGMLQWMTSLPDPVQRGTALKAGAESLLESVPDEFLAWLKTPEGAQTPFAALRQAARNLSKDPVKALEWAAGLRPDAAPLIRNHLLERWFWSGPAAPSDWIKNLPEGTGRAGSITFATGYLAQASSSGELHHWLDSLPASDNPAVLEGLSQAENIDPRLKAGLLTKYRK
ncbi:MAG: hypothetical protein V4726_13790 [Verrucomicrobiota bacterium]